MRFGLIDRTFSTQQLNALLKKMALSVEVPTDVESIERFSSPAFCILFDDHHAPGDFPLDQLAALSPGVIVTENGPDPVHAEAQPETTLTIWIKLRSVPPRATHPLEPPPPAPELQRPGEPPSSEQAGDCVSQTIRFVAVMAVSLF